MWMDAWATVHARYVVGKYMLLLFFLISCFSIWGFKTLRDTKLIRHCGFLISLTLLRQRHGRCIYRYCSHAPVCIMLCMQPQYAQIWARWIGEKSVLKLYPNPRHPNAPLVFRWIFNGAGSWKCQQSDTDNFYMLSVFRQSESYAATCGTAVFT